MSVREQEVSADRSVAAVGLRPPRGLRVSQRCRSSIRRSDLSFDRLARQNHNYESYNVTMGIDITEAAQLLSSLRRHCRGGRPRKMRNCVHCAEKMGTMELRRHEPHCPAKKYPLQSGKPWYF